MVKLARLILCSVVTALVFTSPAIAEPAAPHNSFKWLVFSNGYSPAIFGVEERRLIEFYDHLYKQRDSNTTTVDLLFDTYFAVVIDNNVRLLPQLPADAPNDFQNLKLGYLPGTGIVEISDRVAGQANSAQDLVINRYFFAPQDYAGHGLVMVIQLENKSATTSHTAVIGSIHNFHVGAGPGETGEAVSYNQTDALLSESSPNTSWHFQYHALVSPDFAETKNNYVRLTTNGVATDTPQSGDNLVPGFIWDAGTLGPGATKWYGVFIGYGDKSDQAGLTAKIKAFVAGRSAEQLLNAETKAWADWLATAKIPDSVQGKADWESLYKQSAVFLRMGQVREPNDGAYRPHGQFLASLPGNNDQKTAMKGEIWNISWVRDAALAIVGMTRAGFLSEAKSGLEFMLNAHSGTQYKAQVGFDYLISVTRYFGDGTEESDSNQNGPNIEFDNIGLFLWALGAYIDASNDDALLTTHWDAVKTRVADLLVKLVDPKNGLIRADSSIWEAHWNGQQKQFAYTSIMAVRGLCAAAKIADRVGDTVQAATYRSTAKSVRQAILDQLVDPQNVLAGSVEELKSLLGYTDAAAVEAINFGLVESTIRDATLAAFDTHLFLGGTTQRGYMRNDDGGDYDKQEWVVIDLRMAVAWMQAQNTTKADALIQWVTDQSWANYGIIAEQYDRDTANYRGSVPMVGFGPGAYITALWNRAGVTDIDPCWNNVSVVEPQPDATFGDLGDAATPPDAEDDVTADTSDLPTPDTQDVASSDLVLSDSQTDVGGPVDVTPGVDYTVLDTVPGPGTLCQQDPKKCQEVVDGCGCRLNDRLPNPGGALALLLFVLWGWRRRRWA